MDMAYTSLMITIALVLCFFAFMMLPNLSPILICGLLYLAWFLSSKRNIEYEYTVTNGDLDIDMIINQRKRKRVFSANCKDFEVVAKVGSEQYTKEIRETKAVEDYSSRKPEADLWFIYLKHSGTSKVILFEPQEKMIESFRTFIPRKVFKS